MTRSVARDLADRIVEYLSTDARNQEAAAHLGVEVKRLQLVRDPPEEGLPAEQLLTVLRFWRRLPRIGGIPDVVKIQPEQVRPALGYLMLIDIDEENDDFRYALYGSRIAAVSGFDMTGRSVWDIATNSSIQIFFAACYMATHRLRCPIYSVHEAPPSITASRWHRLILPLGLDGVVKRFLVCNVPIHDGRVR